MENNKPTKNFDEWNIQKKEIHNSGINKFYRDREIWWCDLGINIGFEQDGTREEKSRPVLILKGLSRNTCLIMPLTTSSERHPMRIFLGKIVNRNASAIISQIRVIDTKRLFKKINVLDKEKFEEIRKAVKNLI
ncbi:MAG: type II toxin-antitoxin system PemK/MazF family toxin [Methanosarcinaceae archaeon]